MDQAELVAFRAHGIVCTYRKVEEVHRGCQVHVTAEVKAQLLEYFAEEIGRSSSFTDVTSRIGHFFSLPFYRIDPSRRYLKHRQSQ